MRATNRSHGSADGFGYAQPSSRLSEIFPASALTAATLPRELRAAVARVRRGLRFAFRTVRRTGDADVKVLGVAIPRPHLGKPVAIRSGVAAQRLLDRSIDEDAGDRRSGRSGAKWASVCARGPHVRIDVRAGRVRRKVADARCRSPDRRPRSSPPRVLPSRRKST